MHQREGVLSLMHQPTRGAEGVTRGMEEYDSYVLYLKICFNDLKPKILKRGYHEGGEGSLVFPRSACYSVVPEPIWSGPDRALSKVTSFTGTVMNVEQRHAQLLEQTRITRLRTSTMRAW